MSRVVGQVVHRVLEEEAGPVRHAVGHDGLRGAGADETAVQGYQVGLGPVLPRTPCEHILGAIFRLLDYQRPQIWRAVISPVCTVGSSSVRSKFKHEPLQVPHRRICSFLLWYDRPPGRYASRLGGRGHRGSRSPSRGSSRAAVAFLSLFSIRCLYGLIILVYIEE